jgi:spore germination cell wall hydrolase CwlJ-like protein
MTYQKIVHKSIVYLLIACLLFNTGISGLISMMDVTEKTRKPNIVKIKTNPKDQTRALVNNPQLYQANRAMAAQNRNYQSNTQRSQPVYSGNITLPINDTQYQILVRVIHAEAGGEPLKGQVAVAAVLLNRIRSGRFPKSISANVFRNGEFESVSNGYIWSEPTASAYKAAKLALQGWDPTYGALYFYNPAKTYSSWIWSRPIHTRIGNHYFAG